MTRRASRALTRLPPPLLFVVPLVLGLRVHHAHPQPFVPAGFAGAARGAGVFLIAACVALALSAIGIFIRRQTTIVPHHRSHALVTSGPFRLTRNPMYVALSSAFVGVCLVANAVWPLLFLAVPLIYLQSITIPEEERLLREVFGAEYDSYTSRVRRWL